MRRLVALAALLLATAALAGCLGDVDNPLQESQLGGGSDDGEGTLRIFAQVTEAGDYGEASTTPADPVASPVAGENVSLEAPDGHVDLASEEPVRLGSASVPAGGYASAAFTLTDVHGTYDGSSYEITELNRRVVVDAGVPVDEGSTTTLIVGVDLSASGDPSTGFDPSFSLLAARQDGEALDVGGGNATGPVGEPPVARAEVFNGTGAKIYESDFEAAGGETGAVAKHEEVTWTARPSDDPDGAVDAYEWRFSDGATAEGKTVTHAFDTGGIHAATLVVTDDRGNEDTLTVEIPVRYLVSEDGVDLYGGNASGSFSAGGDDVAPGPAQDETRRSHTFQVPELKRKASSHDGSSSGEDGTDRNASGPDGDGSVSIPVHGGGHGAEGAEDPEEIRRLAAVSFVLEWTGENDAYTLQVTRDGETLAQASGGGGSLTLEFVQVDGWYTDGGNYTAQVQYDQGVDGSYDLDVTGTYIPIPAK